MSRRALVIDGCVAVALAALLLAVTGLGVVALIGIFVVVVGAISLAVEVVVGRTRRGRRGR